MAVRTLIVVLLGGVVLSGAGAPGSGESSVKIAEGYGYTILMAPSKNHNEWLYTLVNADGDCVWGEDFNFMTDAGVITADGHFLAYTNNWKPIKGGATLRMRDRQPAAVGLMTEISAEAELLYAIPYAQVKDTSSRPASPSWMMAVDASERVAIFVENLAGGSDFPGIRWQVVDRVQGAVQAFVTPSLPGGQLSFSLKAFVFVGNTEVVSLYTGYIDDATPDLVVVINDLAGRLVFADYFENELPLDQHWSRASFRNSLALTNEGFMVTSPNSGECRRYKRDQATGRWQVENDA